MRGLVPDAPGNHRDNADTLTTLKNRATAGGPSPAHVQSSAEFVAAILEKHNLGPKLILWQTSQDHNSIRTPIQHQVNLLQHLSLRQSQLPV